MNLNEMVNQVQLYQVLSMIQKQPSRGAFQAELCPSQIVISIKLLCKFVEITLRHGWSPVNLLYIFKPPFPKNTSGWLLLMITSIVSLFLPVNRFKCDDYWQNIFTQKSSTFVIIILKVHLINSHVFIVSI